MLLIVASVFAALSFGCASSDAGDLGVNSAVPTQLPAPIVIDWLDFIDFGGITYLTFRIDKEPPLRAEDLGPEFGKIAFKYDGNVLDPSYRLKNGKDGDAAFLEVGTPVYAVKGYKPEFMLAARRNDEFVLYMSDTIPDAKIGSDLMDLEGKVKYIGVRSPKDGKTEIAAIKDQAQIDTLVQMILDAPIDLNTRKYPDSDVYFLAFYLKDGITLTRGYSPQPNLLSGGMQLPREFRIAIGDALGLSE